MGVGDAKAPMFFAGLILLIPHRIGMSRVNYIIKRYHLPISRAGLLLYKFHNPIEVSLFIGNVLGYVITFKADQAATLKKWMIAVCSAMLLSSIYMFIIYIIGSDYGHLNQFYFSLILITFFDGFTNAFAFGCNGACASLYALGIPTSGLLLTLLHNIYKFFSDLFNLGDFDYYVLLLQLFLNIITLIATIILWAVNPDGDLHPSGGFDGFTELFKQGAGSNDIHYADWSPIGMLAISLGTVYAFYPSIAPYSIIDYQYASVIELWILRISSSPTVIFAVLDLLSNALGPGKCRNKNASDQNPGNSDANCGPGYWGDITVNGNKYGFYHLFWFLVIFYILCIQIFMTMLHYPDCLLSSFFNNKPLRIGFISVLFNTIRECLQALGFSGAGKQSPKAKGSGSPANIKGCIASFNKPITLFVMMFCVFTGDGYLQHYRRCCRDCWPTTGYTRGQSFRYWLRCGFKGGSKSFTTSFTDMYHRNIRQQIISYA